MKNSEDLIDIVPGRYEMIRDEFNRPISKHDCRIIKEYPNFFSCEVDGKPDTIMKAKIHCEVIRLTKKER